MGGCLSSRLPPTSLPCLSYGNSTTSWQEWPGRLGNKAVRPQSSCGSFLNDGRASIQSTALASSRGPSFRTSIIDDGTTYVSFDDFTPVALLGRGTFGEVYLVQKNDTGDLYAMKVVKKSDIVENDLMRYILTERNVLGYLRHPFIVGLKFAFETTEKLVLVLDYCPGGDLAQGLEIEGRFNENRARMYVCELLLALEELHNHDIIYRDLKPANVVLDAHGHALLTDFGLSKEGISENVLAQSFCGSLAYLAPEMLESLGHSKQVDFYLLGVLLYEMLVGEPPFYANKPEELFKNILTMKLSFPRHVSKQAKSLISMLMERDPEKRLGARGVEEIKLHKFFENVDWKAVMNKELRPPVSLVRICEEEMFIESIFEGEELEVTVPGWTFPISESHEDRSH